jgi:hypothetical protein
MQLSLYRPGEFPFSYNIWKMMFVVTLLMTAALAVRAQEGITLRSDKEAPLVVEGESEGDVFGMGRSVEVRGVVKKGVIAFGGDVIVEGRVEGDVGAIGGSVIQRDGSYIGGDVLVFGGAYHHGANVGGRRAESKTIMYAGYEQELREMMRNPSSLLSARWSAAYLGQRLLAVLFWFIASLALTAVSPGAVSRAVARLQLTNLRVAIIGFIGAAACTFGVMACLHVLPTPVGVVVGIMALLLLLMAYIFGRVVIHATTGKWLQRRFLGEGKRSESVTLLIGTAVWTLLLSLPYIWVAVVALLLVTSLGLTLTARYRVPWKQPAASN